jgi:hypothetical protein
MRTLVMLLALLCLSLTVHAQTSPAAEATTRRFAEALVRYDVVAMANELHPDVCQSFSTMAIRIVETTDPNTEKPALLKGLGVASLDDLKKLTPKQVTVKFFQLAFSKVTPQARAASLHTQITIIGSLLEKDCIDVLYRAETNPQNPTPRATVPAVAILKRDGATWKIASTPQMESMLTKLKTLTDGK